MEDYAQDLSLSINEFPNSIIIYKYVNNDFIFIDLNTHAQKSENLSREDVLGKNLMDIFPNIKKFGLYDALLKVQNEDKEKELDIKFYQDERVNAWKHASVQKLSNGNLLVCYKDLSELKAPIQTQHIPIQLEPLGHIMDNSTNEIFIFDVDSLKFTYCNQQALQHLDYTFSEIQEMTPLDIKPNYTLDIFQEILKPLREKKMKSLVFETVHQCKNGDTYDVEIHLECMRDYNLNHFFVIANDISDIKATKEQVALLNQAVEQTDSMIRITNRDGYITYANDSLIEHSGYSSKELIGQSSSIFKSGYHGQLFYKDLWETVLRGDTYRGILINKKKDNTLYHEELTITPMLDNNKEIKNFVLTSQDISQRVQMEEELKRLATVDSLTNIYNRYQINKEIDSEISRAKRYNEEFSLLMFDIDNFKHINDTYGHDSGDYVLQKLSSIVSDYIRTSDKFGRWGGEEFMLLVPRSKQEESVFTANKIREIIQEHSFEYISELTISVGVSVFQADETKETLLKRVDNALYEAKTNGRNCVAYQ